MLTHRFLLNPLLIMAYVCLSFSVMVGGRAGALWLILGCAFLSSYSFSLFRLSRLSRRTAGLLAAIPRGVPVAPSPDSDAPPPYSAAVKMPPPYPVADSDLVFSVNGVEHKLANPSPALLLVDFLRSLGLTGTKAACGEGGCGSCTVIAVGQDGVPRSINACLRLLCACDGLAITTTEGLGSQAAGFSLVQQAIIKSGGSQCGFCTPGWVGAMSALLAKHAASGAPLSKAAIEASLDGNLCRCTGYRPILQAFKAAFGQDASDEERAAIVGDIEDLSTTPCHDVRTGKVCGRECDKACDATHDPPDKARDGGGCCGSATVDLEAIALTTLATTAAPEAVRARARRTVTLKYADDANALSYEKPATLAALQVL